MPTDDSHLIYKVCPAAEWQDAVAAGTYRGSAVDLRDGFIHFSTGAREAVLVKVDEDSQGYGRRTRWRR